MRAVLGLNIYVSALINPSGTPALVVRLGRQRWYEIVVCPALPSVLAEVLGRSSVRRYFTLDGPSAVDPVGRDPDDDYLVALAREAGAERIVTDA